jgi:Xaa-Pro aminopeptidase
LNNNYPRAQCNVCGKNGTPACPLNGRRAAYAEVIQSAGYEYPFRCGRGTGFSFLEKPQLVFGDKTFLQPGMVLAVDGSVSVKKTFRVQVGDSFIVIEKGYEPLTEFAKDLDDVVC